MVAAEERRAELWLHDLFFFFGDAFCTVAKLRDDKALLLHIVNADEVSSNFTTGFLSTTPCYLSTIEIVAVAIVGNPRL